VVQERKGKDKEGGGGVRGEGGGMGKGGSVERDRAAS